LRPVAGRGLGRGLAVVDQALDREDVDAAVAAVLDAWTLPGAPGAVRDSVARMQRRAFELQAAAASATEAPDPLESDPDGLTRLNVPAVVAAGELDKPDFLHKVPSSRPKR
jgi:3-oxoadipate enol-lactonase